MNRFTRKQMNSTGNNKYTNKTFGKKRELTVQPPERSEDVLYFLMTGQLKGGRDLNGVEWSESNK